MKSSSSLDNAFSSQLTSVYMFTSDYISETNIFKRQDIPLHKTEWWFSAK